MARFTSKVENQISGFSGSFLSNVEVTAAGQETGQPTVAVAKTGTLTTRTNATTGSLTMSGGHGINTGDKFDLFWEGGCRHGIVAGTVATNVVPITNSGTGDDLPAAATAITATKGTTKDFEVNGTNVKAIQCYSDVPAYISFRADDDSEIFAVRLVDPADATKGYSYSWFNGNGVTNPITGDVISYFVAFHGDSAATHKPQVGMIFD